MVLSVSRLFCRLCYDDKFLKDVSSFEGLDWFDKVQVKFLLFHVMIFVGDPIGRAPSVSPPKGPGREALLGVLHQGFEVADDAVYGSAVQLVQQLGIVENFQVRILVVPAIRLRFSECFKGYLEGIPGLVCSRKELGLVGTVDAECGENHVGEKMGPTRAPVK